MLHKEGNFSHLQSKSIHADSISTNSLNLLDNTLTSNIQMAGSKIKELYEEQRDTNNFSDKYKNLVDNFNNKLILHPHGLTAPQTFTKLLHYKHIPDGVIPNNHSILCFDDSNNLIHKSKINNTIKYFYLEPTNPHISVNITPDSQQLKVQLNYETN